MYLAKVMGSVVITQKTPALMGKKLMLIKPVDIDEQRIERETKVAVDAVGSGNGDLVLVSQGAAARHVFDGVNEGIDSAIVGIVDSLNR
ncbi:EutN/CcmL family microcompartment protein [Thaumasiovibrio sp. DFM-14]|uniref:EutN/CcmL family microcompartment protein n=1 Tax=Thaumasiovibrio sp. DFM-14 TaxID=3384792 RepID=UPI0039A3762A